jgi:hypothetical protein
MKSLRKYSKNLGANLVNGRWHSALRGTPVYESWRGMKKRCLCPNHEAYHNYGGRGIKICGSLHDSACSIIDCIGDRPKGMTLDRIDNNGHYSCGVCEECILNGWGMNLKWSTPKQQARNARFNLVIEINGEKLIACEWSERLGITRAAFYQRVASGKTGESLTKPMRKRRK